MNDELNDYEKLLERLEESGWSLVWMRGKNWVVPDVPRKGAARMYQQNWDGCRELWKRDYRQRKAAMSRKQ
jgi:hypothetical protein